MEKIEEHIKTHDVLLEEMVKDAHDKIPVNKAEKTEEIDISAWIFRKI